MGFNNALPLLPCQTPQLLPCFADKNSEVEKFNAIPYSQWQKNYQEFISESHDLNHRGYRAQVGFLLDMADKGFIRRSALADSVVNCCPTDKKRLSRLVDMLQVEVSKCLCKHFENHKQRVSSLIEDFDNRSETDFFELCVLTHPNEALGSLLSGMSEQVNQRGIGLLLSNDEPCYYVWRTDRLSNVYVQWLANFSELISYATHVYSMTSDNIVDAIESWDLEEMRTTLEQYGCSFHCHNYDIECNYNYYGGHSVYINTTHHSDFFAIAESEGIRKAIKAIMVELMTYPSTMNEEAFIDDLLESNPHFEHGDSSEIIESVLSMAANDALKANLPTSNLTDELDRDNIEKSRLAMLHKLMVNIPTPETELDAKLQQFILKLSSIVPQSLFANFESVEVDERSLASQNYLVVTDKKNVEALGGIATNLANMETESGVYAFNYSVDPVESVMWLENTAWVHSTLSTVECLLSDKR